MSSSVIFPRIYLDNAATSWPKPVAVYEAVERYQRTCGAPAGRSSYREAVAVSELVSQARAAVARLLGVADWRRIVWTANGTDSLNLAIHGLVRPGDHVVTTEAEHNSVLRPLAWLARHQQVSVDYAPCDGGGAVAVDEIVRRLRPGTRLVSVIHASNVTGAVNDVEALAVECRRRGVLLLVDAAQSLGQWPLVVGDDGPDLIAAPGHKSLLGPLGTGLLYVGPRAAEQLQPTRQGGSGTHSEEETPPQELPERFEAGNLNVSGLVGLLTGVQFILKTGVGHWQAHHRQLTAQLVAGLAAVPGLELFGARESARQLGVVSFRIPGYDPQEFAALLDASCGIQVRAGLHCAPRIHRALGTLERGGTVRMSVGAFTTADEVAQALDAVQELAATA